MRRVLIILLTALLFSYAEENGDYESDFGKMFDANDSYRASIREYDRSAWHEQGRVDMYVDPSFTVKLAPNIFLKTMAIVNINSGAVQAGMIGVDKILFGIEIRFEGF